MLRLPSDHVEDRIDRGHDIFELCSLVVHNHLGPEAANIVEITGPSDRENLQLCLLRQLHRIRSNIASCSVD